MKTIFLLFGCCFFLLAHSQSIPLQELKTDIAYLSSDKQKGRATGSKEEKEVADFISKRFSKLGLQPKGQNGSFLYPFHFKKPLNIHDTIGGRDCSGINVVGYLDNQAKNTVIIGGHFDHLGLGEDGNSLQPDAKGEVHNGADDNASGTAGVLALANYFSQNKQKEKFNFLFICFSGEELGLIGSKKYCEAPTIDFKQVNYMINMDMIGRLNDSTKKLIISGVGTAREWVPLLNTLGGEFKLKKDSSGIGPSDQTSFYLKNIPVLHFFTGQHHDYHRPSDDVEKINFSGEQAVLQYIIRLIEKTQTLPKLEFQLTKNTSPEIRTFKVTMGVMPDYAFEGTGMRIDAVTNARPASKAGLQAGDIVIKMEHCIINNLNDYMKALYVFEKGQTIQVTILRGKDELKFNVTF
ncbi:MAG TPA: M20/M25/M40 family metallo-hydrolase [Bacteroidia bacterium]|jgi:hypothetical protein|nr:M20/M25/M40 family metallo-hydrolase [Bacteroidia bacterium]